MDKLALHGGTPYRTAPFPAREAYGDDEIREVTEAIRSQNLFLSPNGKMAAFEQGFAKLYGVKHAVANSSGSAAIHMAVAAVEAEPGDEIIVSCVTDYGSVGGILYQGLIPVFADWATGTANTDHADIELKITPRTRAIIVVHVYGNPNDMDAIMDIAKRHNLIVIEDCAQAYCTWYKGRLAGTIGHMGCFSMQQSKHLTAGEGGLVITNDDNYNDFLRKFRNKGGADRSGTKRYYTMLGLNYRMGELTAAVGLAQLAKVQNVVGKMNKLGDSLTQKLQNVKGIRPAPVLPDCKHSYWMYPFYVDGFDMPTFQNAMRAEGMHLWMGWVTEPIYTMMAPLADQKTFGNTKYPLVSPFREGEVTYERGICPVAERELPTLGMFRFDATWSYQDIDDAAEIIIKVAAGLKISQSS
jgi:dTDP-4-amino-4,6-dideoxygalactose transaminase